MHEAARAYAQTAQQTAGPRELEAQLLLRAASHLQAVVDGGVTDRNQVLEAIRFNRKLWTVLATSATHAANPLSAEVKQNVGSLGVFILNHSLKLEMVPVPENCTVLVEINRQIAAGLRETVAPAPAAASQVVPAA